MYLHGKACIKCQKFAGKDRLQYLTLKPIAGNAPFQQWGLHFIGEIQPASSGQHKWILIATDLFTKWVEAIPTKAATDTVVMNFLENQIITRFGVLAKITTNNGLAFSSADMSSFCFKYRIVLSHS